jgi:UDP-N-acetylmuramyl pentapeptide phosphotransferase/UDP-N-acetylglucosamine-1-phosphate transferase
VDELIYYFWPVSFIMSFIISLVTIKITIQFLKKTKTIDIPNERSSHIIPTPKGAGLGIIATLLIVYYTFLPLTDFWLMGSILIITTLSFINDNKQVSIIIRLIIQMVLTIIVLNFWPPLKDIILFNSIIPIWIEYIITFLLIIWVMNLFNFMDGIDGISGTQCIIIGVGVGLSLFLAQEEYKLEKIFAGFMAGSSLAFLLWNWHPAKVFLGDAGSIPLGFINAILILLLCKNDLWYVAIIINNYYFFDASITLLRRIKMKKKPWNAHKEHFYQKAILNGYSHSKVCKIIGIHGILLICLSSLAALKPNLIIILFSIVISSLSTIYLLYYLNKKPKTIMKVI